MSDIAIGQSVKGNWIAMDVDADFFWLATTVNDGSAFNVGLLFYDSLGRFYNNGLTLNGSLYYNFQTPVYEPRIRIPAGANIGFDATNASGLLVPTYQIQVMGYKRYRMTKKVGDI